MKPRSSTFSDQEARLAFWMLVPTFTIVVAFVIFPVIWNLWLSFKPVLLGDLRGESLFKPDVVQRALSIQATSPSPRQTSPSSDPIQLTPRELEVLQAAATGERNKEIAVRLGISSRTVKAHLTSVYNKLGVDSRAAAIAIAAQKGWL